MVSVPHGARIEISGTMPPANWSVDLTATHSEGFVTVKILDHLVVEFTPAEASDFARALLKVAES
jgi:hypothetical protein